MATTNGNSALASRIGIFSLPVADPGDDHAALQALAAVRGDVQLAEDAGLGFALLAEHHNDCYGGAIPDPLMAAVAFGQRATRISLGTGVLLATFRHPLLIVDQVTLAARLLPTNLEIGLGKGFLPCDTRDFGIDGPEATKVFWSNVVAIGSEPRYQPFLRRTWVATSTPDGAATVGRLGMGLAINPYTRTDAEVDATIAAYREARAASVTGAPRILIHEPLVLAETGETARASGRANFAIYLAALKRAERGPDLVAAGHALGNQDYAGRCAFFGEDEFGDHLHAWAARGVTHWCFQVRFGNIGTEQVRETITRCARVAAGYANA